MLILGNHSLKWGGYHLKFSAEHFRRDPVVIRKGVRGVEARLADDSFFAQLMGKVEKSLTQGKKFKIVN
jgi:hypothetical protein